MFKISEFSNLSGLTVNTLHHYDEVCILKPDNIDKFTGYRYYNAEQLITVNKIVALKDAGFSLYEISRVLHNSPSVGSLISLLENKAEMLEQEIENESGRLNRLRTNIFLIKNGGVPVMNEVTIKRVEPILIVSTRKHIKKGDFKEMCNMWNEVNGFIDTVETKRTIPCMSLYYNSTWNWDVTEVLDIEVAEPITKYVEGNSLIKVYKLPAVEKMASVLHSGPLGSIGKTYMLINQWMGKNNYQAGEPVREIYHKGEWATDNPNEYVTELQFPIV